MSVKFCHFDEKVTLDQAEFVSLDLDGCHLPGLEAEALRFGAWFGMRGAQVVGDLWMFNARIGGAADLGGTSVAGDFTFGCAVVDGELRLSGFNCTGVTRLRSCRVAGDLDLAGAVLGGAEAGAGALSASGLAVEGSLLAHGATFRGETNLIGVRVGGTLALVDVTLETAAADRWTLLLIEAQAPMATLRPTAGSHGRISLRDARFGRFVDDVVGWPEAVTVELDGFTYERLTHRTPDTARPTVAQRLDWLARQTTATGTGFSPTPYEQLAVALQREGHEQHARQVLRAKERLRHRALGRLGGLWGAVQDAVVGFGYLPARALGWLAFVLACGTCYFQVAGAPRPIKLDEAPSWDPFLYSLDQVVPIVTLGHDSAWNPTGPDKAVTLTLIVAGWVLVTTVVTGVGRTLKRQ